MRGIKQILLALFAGALIAVPTSCKECSDTLILCDLATTAIAPINPLIALGGQVIVRGIVANQKAEGTCYDNSDEDDAGVSKTGYKVQYSKNGSDWEDTEFLVEGESTPVFEKQTKSLKAGQDSGIDNTYTFSDVGQYRFIQIADNPSELDEREEDNNHGRSQDTYTDKSGSDENFAYCIVKCYDPTGKKSADDVVGTPKVTLVKSETAW